MYLLHPTWWSALLIAAASISLVRSAKNPVVQTANGQVQGSQGSTIKSGKTYYSFLGIPYAERPVGQRRFEPPVPKANWNGILKATTFKKPCLQNTKGVVTGSEDCLFVNVFTPADPASGKRLPVLVFLYGGEFTSGNSATYLPDYLLEKNIVVVTLNYRLGIFGFISTGDAVAPGNGGMKDQTLALKWIQKNIQKFGGDPKKVTLSGQGAGSASVAYHQLSPLSQGLFRGAIMESGTSLSVWTLSRNIRQRVVEVARALKVSTSSSKAMVKGLKKINAITLQNSSSSTLNRYWFRNNPYGELPLGPTVEPRLKGAFFTGKSFGLLASGHYAKVPTLTGFTSLQGAYFGASFFGNDSLFTSIIAQYDKHPTRLLPVDMKANIKGLVAAADVKLYYKMPVVVAAKNRFLKYAGDNLFVRPGIEHVRLIKNQVQVYLYIFSYQGGLSGVNRTAYRGAIHGEDLSYLWAFPYRGSRKDDAVRSQMVTMWTNFVKFRNPTPTKDPILTNITWPRAGPLLDYLNIGKKLVVSRNPENSTMAFWDYLYAKFGMPPYDTY